MPAQIKLDRVKLNGIYKRKVHVHSFYVIFVIK